MKTRYKRCLWKFVKTSFEDSGTEQKCKSCNGYKRICKCYIESEKSDIPELMIMRRGRPRPASGGTALAVAQKLGRRWIGIDISPTAIVTVKNRMNTIGARENNDYEVMGMPQKIDDLKHFKPYEFQYWAINELHGTGSPRKSRDMGIDGLSFFEHHPIQVKQSEGIGRNVIDNFETALRRYYKTDSKNMKGYIVAFSFGKGAYEEVSRVKKENIFIELVTVQDILDKKFSVSKDTLF